MESIQKHCFWRIEKALHVFYRNYTKDDGVYQRLL